MGDDLIASVVAYAIEQNGGRATLVGTGPYKLGRHQREVKQARNRAIRIATEVPILAQSHCIIIGPGGLLNEHLYRRFLRVSRVARYMRVPYILAGVGIYEPRSKASRDAYRRLIESAVVVLARDPTSAALALDLAPSALVVHRPELGYSALGFGLASSAERQPTLAVNLRPWEFFPSGSKVKSMRQVADDVAIAINSTKWIESVRLISMSESLQESDTSAMEYLAEKILVPVNFVDFDLPVIFDAIASSRCLLSMRMHGVILGGMAKTPTVGLIYDNKITNATHLGSAAISLEDVGRKLVSFLNTPELIDNSDRAQELIDQSIAAVRDVASVVMSDHPQREARLRFS